MTANNDSLSSSEDIAIIGISVRVADADNYRQLWKNLLDGKESIHIFTDEELDRFGVPLEKRKHPHFVSSQAQIKDAACFDASFFEYTPREATKLDPQHRLFLECAWGALEDAGYTDIDKMQKIGVFAGSGSVLSTYLMSYIQAHPEIIGTTISSELFSLDRDYIATRAAFKLNLGGPACNVQCACSTSLVAVHLGVRAILDGSCEMAIAGGVSLRSPHYLGYIHESGGPQSEDGRCRTFDANTTGTVFGDGIGVVLLKKLSRAIDDGDHIYAVIKSTAMNNDAHLKDNFASPSIEGQKICIESAIHNAKINPETIQFTLAHGTATLVGDPIEVASLAEVYQKWTDLKQYSIISSIKPNLSHTDAAAGIMNLIVAALALYYRKIPPLIGFEKPNPAINFAESPFRVSTEITDWKQPDHPRRVLTTAFGVGGTNACAVLEEAPKPRLKTSMAAQKGELPSKWLLLFSGKTEQALARNIAQLKTYLEENPDTDIQDLSYTLATARSHFNCRKAFSASSIQEAISKLAQWETSSNTLKESSKETQGKDDSAQHLESLMHAYEDGEAIDWKSYYAPYGGTKLSLPTYAFEKERFWVQPSDAKSGDEGVLTPSMRKVHPLLGHMWKNPLHITAFSNEIDLKQSDLQYLKDHSILGHILFPAAGFVEMMAGSAKQLLHLDHFSLFDVEIKSPLLLSQDDPKSLAVIVEKEENNYKVSISSEAGIGNWQLHAVGYFTMLKNVKQQQVEPFSKELVQEDATKTAALYQGFQKDGYEYGPAFRAIQNYAYESEISKGFLRLPTINAQELIHPALLDGCLQLLIHELDPLKPTSRKSDAISLPVFIESLNLYHPLPTEIICAMKKLDSTADNLTKVDIDVFSLSNELVAEIRGATFLESPKANLLRNLSHQKNEDILYAEKWEEQPLSTPAESAEKVTFLIFASSFEDPFYGEFLDELTKSGSTYIQVESGAHYQKIAANHYQIPQNSAESYNQLWSDLQATPWQKMIIFHPFNPNPTAEISETVIAETIDGQIQPLFHLLHAFFDELGTNPPPVYTVARGIWNQLPNSSYADTLVIGLYRGLLQEYPKCALTLMDVDPSTPLTKGIPLIISEISNTSDAREIYFQNSKRYVNKIAPYSEWMKDHSVLTLPASPYYRLVKGNTQESTLNHIDFKEFSRPQLKDDEVEISVRAVGLNFRDLLNALNLYPGDPGPLGGDCAGVIVQAGKNVVNCKPGDFVLGFALGCLGDYVITPALHITPKPKELSFPTAAAIPTVFLTAYHGLVKLAKLKHGDKVLIHAGAGGVGLAAIQVAQQIGAVIYATCSTPQKREYLQNLGVTHIYDSRSLNYAEEIMKDTDGAGVNVVLNSLSGEGFIDASLSACAKDAHFLEIGKRNIWTAEEMQSKRPDIKYFVIALDEMLENEREYIQTLLVEVKEHFSKGNYHPIRHTAFPLTRVKEALLSLQKAQQIGKMVIQMPPKWHEHIKENRSYLITGGLGGIGLIMAEWLIQKGAKHIVLAGRKAPSAQTQEKLDAWMNAGTEIRVVTLDVSHEPQVKALFDDLMQNAPPLAGIIHAAGVDIVKLFSATNWNDYKDVFVTKVWGSVYLQNQIERLAIDLDFLLHFSSSSSLTGVPGQAGYCGANSFLDAYARYQFQRGTPVVCLNWPAWNSMGMALAYLDKSIAAGFTLIEPDIALPIIDSAIDQQYINVATMILDWNTYVKVFPVMAARCSKLTKQLQIKTETEKSHESLLAILAMQPRENWADIIQAHLQELARAVTGAPKSSIIDPKATYVELGLDSLSRNEFIASIEKALDYKKRLNFTLLNTHPTIESFSAYLAKEVADGLVSQQNSMPPPAISKEIALTQKDLNAISEVEMDPPPQVIHTGTKQDIPKISYQWKPLAEQEWKPLSYTMEFFKLVNLLSTNAIAQHIAGRIHIDAAVDTALFEKAINILLAQNPIFYIVFHKYKLTYKVHPFVSFKLKVNDLSQDPNFEQTLSEKFVQFSHTPKPANEVPLLQAILYKLPNEKYEIFIAIPHMIGDLFTIALAYDKIVLIYADLLKNFTIPAYDPTDDYLECIPQLNASTDIFIEKNAQELEKARQSYTCIDFNPTCLQGKTTHAAELKAWERLPREIIDKIDSFAIKNNLSTPFILEMCLTLSTILISTNQSRFSFISHVHGRMTTESAFTIGPFLSSYYATLNISDELPLLEFIHMAKKEQNKILSEGTPMLGFSYYNKITEPDSLSKKYLHSFFKLGYQCFFPSRKNKQKFVSHYSELSAQGLFGYIYKDAQYKGHLTVEAAPKLKKLFPAFAAVDKVLPSSENSYDTAFSNIEYNHPAKGITLWAYAEEEGSYFLCLIGPLKQSVNKLILSYTEFLASKLVEDPSITMKDLKSVASDLLRSVLENEKTDQ